ncbi:hypothetical protein G6F57_005719 [Rhizopus arrhizus]|uniref:BZIP domain-containing protein n=1 Tax=Rhizopus oryzae TaxID=64495 RepID=A0A9P6WZ81_RHIOR|nr:hypothetical protein G6F23_009130 [Rhizopus arrhizus]KAG1405900.1 hypothetical protein G6F58_009929 [Rhizopus delemar]KAG0763976.1 hypothetical protein G6F24_005589 [Rhizopus arrhizus]KAG0781809.1 hypothetical protein G6F21_011449 [Rhizopus arrhizus]KAG0785864.1 hypothetical protein G6F22_007811 [Rhizopus arrhizus]
MNRDKLTCWGLNANDLNDWLENDLRETKLLQRGSIVDEDRQYKEQIKERIQSILSSGDNHDKNKLSAIKLLLSLKSTQQPTSRKRPIDEPMEVILKRQRNTDAARRSRLRKTLRMESLENRVQELNKENEQLRVKVAVLESKVNHISEKESRNRQRVLELEAQLASVHQQLLLDSKAATIN